MRRVYVKLLNLFAQEKHTDSILYLQMLETSQIDEFSRSKYLERLIENEVIGSCASGIQILYTYFPEKVKELIVAGNLFEEFLELQKIAEEFGFVSSKTRRERISKMEQFVKLVSPETLAKSELLNP